MARDWDVVVIGAGVAGVAAAKAAAKAGASVVVIDRMGPGGVLMNLPELHGVEGAPAGMDYVSGLFDQATEAGAELVIAEVSAVSPTLEVTTDDEAHQGRAVVLAVGLGNGRLGLDGEDGFEGMGLSHCAACDGPLYRGQRVVVAGHDHWAVQEALDLAPLVEQVTLVTQGGAVEAADAAALAALGNVTVLPGRVTALLGEGGLDGVAVDGTPLPARAIFVQWGRVAPLHIMGDASAPGVFLAGDCVPGAVETVAAAEAAGARAGTEAARFALGQRAG